MECGFELVSKRLVIWVERDGFEVDACFGFISYAYLIAAVKDMVKPDADLWLG